jgi:hypothetical protein
VKALGDEVAIVVLPESAEKLNPGGLLPAALGFVKTDTGWVGLMDALLTDCWPCVGGAAVEAVVALPNPWLKSGMTAAVAPRVAVAAAENTDGNNDPWAGALEVDTPLGRGVAAPPRPKSKIPLDLTSAADCDTVVDGADERAAVIKDPVGAEADRPCRRAALADVSPGRGCAAAGLAAGGATALGALETALIGCGGGVLP